MPRHNRRRKLRRHRERRDEEAGDDESGNDTVIEYTTESDSECESNSAPKLTRRYYMRVCGWRVGYKGCMRDALECVVAIGLLVWLAHSYLSRYLQDSHDAPRDPNEVWHADLATSRYPASENSFGRYDASDVIPVDSASIRTTYAPGHATD